MTDIIPCGGCGATENANRCIGCLHDFGDPESKWTHKYTKPAMTDISRERCERLAHNLRGDWYEATADLITALRAALDKAEETIGESALQYLSDTGQLMEQIARLKEREEYLVDLLDRITDYQAVIDCLSIPELNEVTDAMAEYTKGVKDDLGT